MTKCFLRTELTLRTIKTKGGKNPAFTFMLVFNYLMISVT
jgi:hypothetical protein